LPKSFFKVKILPQQFLVEASTPWAILPAAESGALGVLDLRVRLDIEDI
jgi:hypothetical protein